jgi:hypothetical protein
MLRSTRASNSLQPTRVETSRGTYDVTWGVNSWVLIDGRGLSMQRRVTSQRDLARLLADTGLPVGEADTRAASVWRSRPRDAGSEGARPSNLESFDQQSWHASAGLPSWAPILVVGIAVLVFVVLTVFAR